VLAVLPDATLYYGAADTGIPPVAGNVSGADSTGKVERLCTAPECR
jgi:hypothetical protein